MQDHRLQIVFPDKIYDLFMRKDGIRMRDRQYEEEIRDCEKIAMKMSVSWKSQKSHMKV
jgi:hypothetical protein